MRALNHGMELGKDGKDAISSGNNLHNLIFELK